MKLLSDMKIVVLVEDGVNQNHVAEVRDLLQKAGVTVDTASLRAEEVKARSAEDSWEIRIKVDRRIGEISIDDYDGLFVPGGSHCYTLITNATTLDLARQFFASGKVVATLEEALEILVEADAVDGRRVTGSPHLQEAVTSAGGIWENDALVADNGLITGASREPLQKFARLLLDKLREGVHQRSETII